MSIKFLTCGVHQLSWGNVKLQILSISIALKAKNINTNTWPSHACGARGDGPCPSMCVHGTELATEEISMSHVRGSSH